MVTLNKDEEEKRQPNKISTGLKKVFVAFLCCMFLTSLFFFFFSFYFCNPPPVGLISSISPAYCVSAPADAWTYW